MKVSLLLSLSLFISINLFSQADDTLSTNIYQKDGKLGIGIDSPTNLLHVEKNINDGSDRRMVFINNTSTSEKSFAGLSIQAGANSVYTSLSQFSESYAAIGGMADYTQLYNSGKGIALTTSLEGEIRFMSNESSGINSTNMMISSDGNLGIGNAAPQYKLHLNDDNTQVVMGKHPENEGTVVSLYNSNGASAPMLSLSVARKNTYYGSAQLTKTDWAHLYGNKLTQGIALIADHTDGFSNGIFLTNKGNLGVGVSEPAAKLHVADGDIYISDIDKGIVMKSPDGQCWRGVLDNSGQLNFSQIDCPSVSSATTTQEVGSFKSTSITIYPNPTNGEFTVEFPETDKLLSAQYYIYSASGSMLDSGSIKSQITKIDISEFQAGSYILTIKNNSETLRTQQIIKN